MTRRGFIGKLVGLVAAAGAAGAVVAKARKRWVVDGNRLHFVEETCWGCRPGEAVVPNLNGDVMVFEGVTIRQFDGVLKPCMIESTMVRFPKSGVIEGTIEGYALGQT